MKDTKNKDRGNEDSDRVFCIGPKTKMETDMQELLKLPSFKIELLRFFFNEIEDQIYAPIIGNKLLYVAIDNNCKKFIIVNGKLFWENVDELYGYHLEGNIRVTFHAKHADIKNPGEIVVRGNDTDIAIILLANINLFSSEVWYESGLDYNNTGENLSITKLKQVMGNSEAWIGLYSFLSNDYTPAFYGKGKVQPINLALINEKFVNIFSSLGINTFEKETFSKIGRYVCFMYGTKKTCNINDVIKSMFEEISKPMVSSRPLENIKSIDPTPFPPCKKIIEQQTRRAWFISHLYKTAGSRILQSTIPL